MPATAPSTRRGEWGPALRPALGDAIPHRNAGQAPHTLKFLPWRIETAVAFRGKTKAATFEKYLKSQSGRAFAKKHF